MGRVSPTTYRFSDAFTVAAPPERVHAVLADLEHYVDWWRQVRAVAKVDDDHALVVCRSTLPYDLELALTAVRRDPELLEVGIDGPIRGWARFHLTPGRTEGPGPATRLVFEQQVRAEAPVMVLASYAVKPVLAWNHQQMMRGAREGLQRLGG
jgi:uncharacterized protein YndB with AHSA1/START domain